MFSHGSTNVRGVAVLIRSGLDRIVIQPEHSDSNGRLIMRNAKIKEKSHFLINFYVPNIDAEAVRFYQDLSITLRGYVILGGDFHCSLDPTFDKKGGTFNSSTTCDKLDWKH